MRRESSGALTGLEILDGALAVGMKIAAALVVAITGYYVYATVAVNSQLFHGMTDTGQPMSFAQFQHHLAHMENLTKVLLLASGVLILCVLGRFYSYAEAGVALVGLGALLFLGMPFLIDTMGGAPTPLPKALARLGDPRVFLKEQYHLAGMAFGAVGLAQLIVHAFRFVGGMRERRPQPNAEAARTAAQVRKPQDKFLGKCWELPFCRDTDKKLCPIRQTGKPCWQTGRGCYCDQNVILAISGGNTYVASRGSAGYLSRAATIVKPKTLREKREQCMACPIYLHHQGQKYRIIAPASLIATIAALVHYWGPIRSGYPDAVKAMGKALSGFSFGSSTGGVPSWAADLAGSHGVMWMLLLIGAMLLIAYVLHGVEWLLYRLGI